LFGPELEHLWNEAPDSDESFCQLDDVIPQTASSPTRAEPKKSSLAQPHSKPLQSVPAAGMAAFKLPQDEDDPWEGLFQYSDGNYVINMWFYMNMSFDGAFWNQSGCWCSFSILSPFITIEFISHA
jgi:hypothetical protein